MSSRQYRASRHFQKQNIPLKSNQQLLPLHTQVHKEDNDLSPRAKYDNYTPRKRYSKDSKVHQNNSFPFQQFEEDMLSMNQYPKYQSTQLNNQSFQKNNLDQGQHQKQIGFFDQNYPKIKYFEKANENRNQWTSPLKLIQPNLNQNGSRRFQTTAARRKNTIKINQSTINKKLNFQYKLVYELNEQKSKENLSKIKELHTSPLNLRRNNQFIQKQLTPSRVRPAIQNGGEQINIIQKMTVLQSKLKKMDRMTPRNGNSYTPQKRERENLENNLNLLERNYMNVDYVQISEDKFREKHIFSDKEEMIMSKNSLQRLLEQRSEEMENDIEVIQDLSFRISSKLQQIIKNYS